MINSRRSQRHLIHGRSLAVSQSPPRWRPRRLLVWAGFCLAVVVGVVGLEQAAFHIDRSYAAAVRTQQVAALHAALGRQLAPVLKAYPNIQTAVAVVDLKTDAASSFGSPQPFTAASITKLTTAIYFLHLVETGQQSLNQQLDGYPASWQLQQMVQESDNDSWTLLDNLVGYQQLGAYAHHIGLVSFDLSDNTITASDEAVLLQKLATGQLLDHADTALLFSYMQHTNDNSLIPAALPAGATAYHKYGEIDFDVHDAAIVHEQDRSFVLVIFTNQPDTVNYPQRTQLIHALTQAVVRAFS